MTAFSHTLFAMFFLCVTCKIKLEGLCNASCAQPACASAIACRDTQWLRSHRVMDGMYESRQRRLDLAQSQMV